MGAVGKIKKLVQAGKICFASCYEPMTLRQIGSDTMKVMDATNEAVYIFLLLIHTSRHCMFELTLS